MSGPVWRFTSGARATCDGCFRECEAHYAEGEVNDNAFSPLRSLCPDCYRRANGLVVAGEVGTPSTSPAYFGRR